MFTVQGHQAAGRLWGESSLWATPPAPAWGRIHCIKGTLSNSFKGSIGLVVAPEGC